MIIIFRNLQFLNDYIELIKSFLLKKIPGKKCFFCADFWSAKVFSLLIILIDPRQVLSYLIRIPLLNQANHAIWQKSLSISIVLAVFSWILEVNASKEKKKSMFVFVLELRIRSGLHSRKVELSHVKYIMPLLALPTICLSHRCKQYDKRRWSWDWGGLDRELSTCLTTNYKKRI